MSNKYKPIRLKIWEEQKGLCWWCGIRTDESPFAPFNVIPTLDHLIPKCERKDLKLDPYNLVLSCGRCNQARSYTQDKTRDEKQKSFGEYLGVHGF